MAKILKEVLGNLLPPQFEKAGILPSPEKLQNKVLLKGKILAFTDADEEEEHEQEIAAEDNKGKGGKETKDKSGKKRN